MTLIDVGGIIVAVIAALGAWAAQRSAAKASRTNILVEGRLEVEKDAYERARTFDIQTITRQDTEIADLRARNEKLAKENAKLRKELNEVKVRLAKLEEISPAIERLLYERLEEYNDDKE